MGFLDIFKRKGKSETESKETLPQKDFKAKLDMVQNEVYAWLKPQGFKKNGRTFNRKLEGGIIQVINFQVGKYHNGKFVINLGVCVESLYQFECLYHFQSSTELKKYYKEYECQIRDRLGVLLTGEDNWWVIADDNNKTTEEIIAGLQAKGFEWFAGVETKEKIIANHGCKPYVSSPRAKLDVALVVWFDDKEKGSELFKDYYNNIQPATSPHKEYVRDLAKELKIEL